MQKHATKGGAGGQAQDFMTRDIATAMARVVGRTVHPPHESGSSLYFFFAFSIFVTVN
jgi:hypothetical protein